MKSKKKDLFYQISAILILFAAIFYMFYPTIAAYIMIIGVSGFGAVTFTTPYPGKSIRGKRLFNMQVFAVLLMAVSAYLMYIEKSQWVVSLLIAAILILYSSIVLPKIYDKENK